MTSRLMTTALLAVFALAGSLTFSIREAAAQNPLPVLDSPSTGNGDALVTIIAFYDFQCPFSYRASGTIDELTREYGQDKVRVVVKHLPLAYHDEADPAARAAIAAHKQGKFWRMHDFLFKHQTEFKRYNVDEYMTTAAGFIGLDQTQFAKDYKSSDTRKLLDRDKELAANVGARGTPHFFINGIRISGAQPIHKFKELIDAELATTKALISKGEATRSNIYEKRAAVNYRDPEPPKPEPKDPDPPKPYKPPGSKVSDVQIDPAKHPILGNSKKALVTIVIFSDFQCPFCKRAVPTLEQIEEEYGSDVRFVFRHLPLPFHKQAEPAARAAWAAQQQGKFWEMHDLLFENQKAMKDNPEIFVKLANDLGLNIKKFERDFESDKAKALVKEDNAYAAKVGARGTPNFFINGIQLIGAQPLPRFKEEIDRQIEIARDLKREDKKLSGEKLYKATVKHNLDNYKPEPPPEKPAEVLDAKTYADLKKYASKGAPVKGNLKKAKVIIYEFTDLQCPYCNRASSTLDQLEEEYGDRIAIVSLAKPLPFHREAEPAARAALAAGKQGKFWEMRALLFENQRQMKGNPELFVKLANDLGLDIKKFERDMKDPAIAKQVKADLEMADKLGVRGTPTFFVNNKRLVGAQPFDKFKSTIDKELE